MKKTLLLFTLFLLSNFLQAQNTWTQKASLPGVARDGAFAFTIGTIGYLGGGEDASNNDLADFWQWDQGTNVWTQKAGLNTGRSAAMGFAINGKGYACMGYSGAQLNDMWVYDPGNNTWAQEANFPGAGRYGAAGFAVGNKAYIGMGCPGGGNGPPSTDFWEYDPSTNSWAQKASSPMPARRATVGAGVGAFGYMGFGYDGSITTYYSDWWRYDPSTNSWLQRSSLPASARAYPNIFSMSASIFACAGNGPSGFLNDLWEYNTYSDTWTQRLTFPGTARTVPIGFSIGSKGYLATGLDASANHYNDLWEYAPIDLATNDIANVINSCSVYPTMITQTATLEIRSTAKLSAADFLIFDLSGKLMARYNVTQNIFSFEKANLASGTYLFMVNSDGKNIGSGKFIIQ